MRFRILSCICLSIALLTRGAAGKIIARPAPGETIKVDSIEQVMTFFVDSDGRLGAKTALKIPQGAVILEGTGLPGNVQLFVLNRVHHGDAAEEVNFQFTQREGPIANDPQALTTVASQSGRLIISRDSEAGDQTFSVQLVQDPPPSPEAPLDEPPIRLLIRRTGSGGADLDLKFAAASFMELRRTHRGEVDTYLRPIVRRLGGEPVVFAVAPQVAWQVLGGAYPLDPKVAERVHAAVQKLNSEQFREREAAMEELKSLGEPGALVLAKIDRNSLSPEQNSAVDTALAEFAPLRPQESDQLRRDPSFLLDVLYTDDETIRGLAWKRLKELAGTKIDIDTPPADPTARAAMVAKLRAQLSPASQPNSR